MVTSTRCPWCGAEFAFDPAVTPAQRAGRGRGPVVAYYPTCPRCRERLELDNPPAPVGPSRARVVRPGDPVSGDGRPQRVPPPPPVSRFKKRRVTPRLLFPRRPAEPAARDAGGLTAAPCGTASRPAPPTAPAARA
jgi:hypothetical protein